MISWKYETVVIEGFCAGFPIDIEKGRERRQRSSITIALEGDFFWLRRNLNGLQVIDNDRDVASLEADVFPNLHTELKG